MHAMIRSYSGAGATELFDLLVERKAEVEEVLRDVPGLVSYALMRSADGGATVTICRDSAGTDESLKRAKAWLQENASHLGTTPHVQEGPVELQFTV
ncbi:MAG: hypothetical protein ACU0B9_16505 [Limimaricola soesokkakensis]|uniref:hypothetical protein n=1 Tax=Limimaricola soesokkakensis TaxID=1343159 RepID=UPI004059A19B